MDLCVCTDINIYADSKNKLLFFHLVAPFIKYKIKVKIKHTGFKHTLDSGSPT